MTMVKRSVKAVTDGAGAATGTIGLGAKYGKVIAVRWDSGGDSSSDLTLSSSLPAFDSGQAAFTHNIYVRTSVDASAAGGIVNYVGPVESIVYDAAGDATADTEGMISGIVAHSPVTYTIANGGATETHYIDLFVEV